MMMLFLSFKTAIDIKPSYGAAYHAMGITYAKLEDYSRSAESLNKAVELQPKEFLVMVSLS
jgi:Tfp pilus assembly protein PilF